ncbi:MAG: DUF1778 domain-containing protein [Armatimonadetes bacterium]|nr:DUF1778 domain-containing protein [Armatimonadota bacterium]
MITTSEKHDARLGFRLSRVQKEMIERAASLSGQSVSDFVASTSLTAASEVVERHNRIVLSQGDWELFRRLLDAETEPTEAAKQAAARYNQGHVSGTTYEC